MAKTAEALVWAKLKDQIEGIAWKILTSHEVDPEVSNGHEFQGINRLRELLGNEDRVEDEQLVCEYARYEDASGAVGATEETEATASWYDSRRNQAKRSAEWRLYYPAEAGFIQQRCRAGDLMVLVKRRNGKLRILLIEQGSTWQRKAEVLFGIEFSSAEQNGIQLAFARDDQSLSFAVAEIAEEFGLVAPDELAPADHAVAEVARWLIEGWPEKLPHSRLISGRIREVVDYADPYNSPDDALMAWMEREEAAFRQWERAKVERWLRCQSGLGDIDVDSFLSFSMSVFQTRKSRAGAALQNHADAIFKAHKLCFVAPGTTEHGEKPDFLFPGQQEYNDLAFPEDRLRLLGVKTTAKDRFRQVLHEGQRVKTKHLLTLEAGISEKLTANMRASHLQLVVPRGIRTTYTASQQTWVWTLSDFIKDVQSASC